MFRSLESRRFVGLIFSLTDFCRFEPKNISDKIGLNRLDIFHCSLQIVNLCYQCDFFRWFRCPKTNNIQNCSQKKGTRFRAPFPDYLKSNYGVFVLPLN